VEPDEAVIAKQDTINIINSVIVNDTSKNWERIILGYKLSEITGDKKNPEFQKSTSIVSDMLDNLI
jgi:hypothetical protein